MAAQTIDEVVARLQELDRSLPPTDGVRWFSRLYLDVTLAVRDYCRSGKLGAPYLKKGCVVPKHAHHNEQITYILDGALRFRLGADLEQQVDVHAGEVLVIPGNLPHTAEALEDTLDVDIFDPPREDWLNGTDAYLREK